MNQTQRARINTHLALVAQQTGHLYRMGTASTQNSCLGEHYMYVERRVDATRQPYVRETFGEWMNFLELSRQSGPEERYTSGTDPLGTRICTESLLTLIYSSSVIPEASILREVLDVMATLGYMAYGVAVGGRDDHLEVRIELRGDTDSYHIDLTVNTK